MMLIAAFELALVTLVIATTVLGYEQSANIKNAIIITKGEIDKRCSFLVNRQDARMRILVSQTVNFL
ncbi:MAG: hypothetical protein M3044_00175 [Thermoproteota archaeon]|nr:hypothetical protein [Thermoproteota archaeon]